MITILKLAWALAVVSQVAAPGDLSIDGPAKASVGQEVRLVVQGLPELDPTQPLAAGLAWVDTIRVEVSSPTPGKHTLTRRLGLSFAPIAWQLELVISATDPGDYVVVIDWNQPPYGLTLHRLTVAGLGPQPPPVVVVPDPPLPPSPADTTGVAYLIVVRHNQDLTADQAATLLNLRVWSDANPSKVTHLEISPDAGSADARLASYVAQIPAGSPLPWVLISRARSDGRGAAVLWSGPLPATAEPLIATAERLVQR